MKYMLYILIYEKRVPSPFEQVLPHDHRLESSMQFSLPCDRSQGVLVEVHEADGK